MFKNKCLKNDPFKLFFGDINNTNRDKQIPPPPANEYFLRSHMDKKEK